MHQMMFLASSISRKSKLNYKLGAVVYNSRGKVCGIGMNQSKTHPVQAAYAKKAKQEYRISLHAEIAALIDSLKNSKERPYGVAVARTTHSGFGLAKPCPICMAAIVEAGIKEIIYTTNDTHIEVLKL